MEATNPRLLVCDADALAQLFLANEIRPLKHLKDAYGIQPAIVEEVDVELRWLGRHRDRFVAQLNKTLRSATLVILNAARFQSLLSAAPVGASWERFLRLGAQYEGHIHRGEAYTFAAATTLNLPALSNDFNAIKTLEANMLSMSTPVLRSFDLVCFCLETGFLEMRDCEGFRAELLKNREGVPKAFMHASFKDGAANFTSRLRQGVAPVTSSLGSYSSPLHITKL